MPYPSRPPLLLSALPLLLLLMTTAVQGQVIFGARVAGQNGPVTGLFRAENGAVSSIPTGLISNDFPSLSPNGRLILLSSPDPLHPHDVSWDLFLRDMQNGGLRMVVNNTTFQYPNAYTRFATPMFSGLSSDNRLIAFTNQISSTGTRPSQADPSDPYPFGLDTYRLLSVVDAATGSLLSWAEIGIGATIDYFSSEFFGISWWPFGSYFVTSAYVPVVTNLGRHTWAAGIVLYGPDQGGQFVRIGQYTQPQVFEEYGVRIVTQTHALPVFSPDARRLAYFQITYPSAVLTEPATTELMVMNTDGTGTPTTLASFQPGVFPTGLSWSMDGSRLVFSIGQQHFADGIFLPAADQDSSVLRTVNSTTGGALGTVAGAATGYFPNAKPALIFRGGFEN